jgi:hypothetical protein
MPTWGRKESPQISVISMLASQLCSDLLRGSGTSLAFSFDGKGQLKPSPGAAKRASPVEAGPSHGEKAQPCSERHHGRLVVAELHRAHKVKKGGRSDVRYHSVAQGAGQWVSGPGPVGQSLRTLVTGSRHTLRSFLWPHAADRRLGERLGPGHRRQGQGVRRPCRGARLRGERLRHSVDRRQPRHPR